MDQRLYQQLIPLLDMPTKPDGQGRIWSYCPLHGDGSKHGKTPGTATNLRGRSLSLHPKFGLQCFGGCNPLSGVDKEAFKRLLDALGYKRDNDRPMGGAAVPSPLRPNSDGGGAWVLRDTYHYSNEANQLVAIKGRWEMPDPASAKGYTKRFMWRRPETTWKTGLHIPTCDDPCTAQHMLEMPLYNSEKVAIEPVDRPVWFVEGEQALRALERAGELVVCHGGGAATREFAEGVFDVLRGRYVRLWPDNDELGLAFMANVRKALVGIVKSISIVTPPNVPKGDAWDWLVDQGKSVSEAMESMDGVLTETAVDVINDAHFRVRIPTDIGQVQFEFEDMQQAKYALDADLTVRLISPSNEADPYAIRINLKSASSRSALETSLGKMYGKGDTLNWTRLVNTAWNRATEAFKQVERGMLVAELPDPAPRRWVLPNLIPAGGTTLIFGDGSAGKSYTAIGIGSAIATKGAFAGIKAQEQMGVMYVDWETPGRDGQGEFKRRCQQVWLGMDYDAAVWPDIPFHYWGAQGAPLQMMVDPLARFIAKHDIGLMIIDSAMPACGGAPEDAEIVLSFFNAINKLGVTTLILSHVSKEAQKENRVPDRAYGTQVWHNMPRLTFLQHRKPDDGGPTIDYGLYPKKSNNGPKPSPLGVRLNFDPSGPAYFERYEIAQDPELGGIQELWIQCRQLLQDHAFAPSGYATLKDIANELGKQPKEIFAAMNAKRAHKGNGEQGIFRYAGGNMGDPEMRWALNAGDVA